MSASESDKASSDRPENDKPVMAPAPASFAGQVGGESVAAAGSPSESPNAKISSSGGPAVHGHVGTPSTPASLAPTPMAPSLAPTDDQDPSPPVTSSGPLSEDHVREELKKVIDPELFVNIVDLGLIYVVDLVPRDDGKQTVKIDMTMTSPACPAGPQLIQNSKQVLSMLPTVGSVEIRIVLDPPWTPDRMTEAARDQLGIF